MSNGDEPGPELIEPLRKRKLGDGPIYSRPSDIEELLRLLIVLPVDEAIARARIRNRRAAGWLPGECVIYMTRRAAHLKDRRSYQRWYDVLAERIRAGLPRPVNQHRPAARELEVAETGFDRFLEMLATDLNGYDERLDIWEARFDLALANLRQRLSAIFGGIARPRASDGERPARRTRAARTGLPGSDPEGLGATACGLARGGPQPVRRSFAGRLRPSSERSERPCGQWFIESKAYDQFVAFVMRRSAVRIRAPAPMNIRCLVRIPQVIAE